MTKIKTRRRDPNAIVGFVNFPTHRKSTGEGGQFVRLVVLDTPGDRAYMRRYIPCCGGYHHISYDESFLGDDLVEAKVRKLGAAPPWAPKDPDRGWAKYRRYTKKVDKIFKETQQRYFPGIDDPSKENEANRYTSRAFLATLTLGATGWSGQWRCTFNHLTAEGKKLYRSVQKLYPGCELRLLTFLDT